MQRLWNRILDEPAIVLVALVAAAQVINTQVGIPDWLHVTAGIIVAIGGALGLRSRVTPTRKL